MYVKLSVNSEHRDIETKFSFKILCKSDKTYYDK